MQKLARYRAGEPVSDLQRREVLGLLELNRGKLDLDDMRHWATDQEVSDLLEHALREHALRESGWNV